MNNIIKNILDMKKKGLYILTEEDKVGEKLSDNSYDGAMGKIEKSEIDLFMKSEPIFIESDFIDFTYPTAQETYYLLEFTIITDHCSLRFVKQES